MGVICYRLENQLYPVVALITTYYKTSYKDHNAYNCAATYSTSQITLAKLFHPCRFVNLHRPSPAGVPTSSQGSQQRHIGNSLSA